MPELYSLGLPNPLSKLTVSPIRPSVADQTALSNETGRLQWFFSSFLPVEFVRVPDAPLCMRGSLRYTAFFCRFS